MALPRDGFGVDISRRFFEKPEVVRYFNRNRNRNRNGQYPHNQPAAGGAAATLATLAVVESDIVDSTSADYTDALTFAVEANTTYEIDLNLYLTTAAASTGHVFNVEVPSGASGYFGLVGPGAQRNQYIGAIGDPQTWLANFPASSAGVIGKIIVTIGDTAGNVTLQFNTEINASAVTVKAGSYAVVREVEISDTVTGSDVGQSTNGTFSTVWSLDLEAGKTYYLDGLMHTETLTDTVGLQWKVEDSAADATILFAGIQQANAGNVWQGFIRRDNTLAAAISGEGVGFDAVGRPIAMFRGLIQTTSATTITLQITTEVTSTNVAAKVGSFITAREVTATVLESNVVNSNASVPTTVHTFTLEADKHYIVNMLHEYTASDVGISLRKKFTDIPADSLTTDEFLAVGHHSSAGAASLNSVSINETAYSNSAGSALTGNQSMDSAHIEVDGTGGDMLWQVDREHFTGDLTILAGSFAILEEVTLQR